jgi:hypothetical protein
LEIESAARKGLLDRILKGVNIEYIDSGFPEDLQKSSFESDIDYVRATNKGKMDYAK